MYTQHEVAMLHATVHCGDCSYEMSIGNAHSNNFHLPLSFVGVGDSFRKFTFKLMIHFHNVVHVLIVAWSHVVVVVVLKMGENATLNHSLGIVSFPQ